MIRMLSASRPVAMADSWFEYARVDHFWIEWRLEALKRVKPLLPPSDATVLEVGCGSGVFRQQLEGAFAYCVDGCDLNVNALQLASPGRGELLVYDINDRRPDLLGKYAAVFLMDVIEHIEDDVSFLCSASAHARPGGIVVINVPANQWLFSRYDETVGHVRRYNRTTVVRLLRDAGLVPLDVRYWGLSMLPLLMARKLALSFTSANTVSRGFEPPGRTAHRMLKWVKNAETTLLSAPVYGTSLLAVAQVGPSQ